MKYLLEEEKENFQKFEMDEFINKPGLDSLLDEDVSAGNMRIFLIQKNFQIPKNSNLNLILCLSI